MVAILNGDIIDEFVEEPEPVEDEFDLEKLLLSELSSALVQATDWTTDTILQLIEKDRIQLDPIFQRRDAWTQERKSRFIESLLLGFPIPQLVLAESHTRRGRYIVIDGKQRLLSLVQFAGSSDSFTRLRLKGLEILDRLNGQTLEEIEAAGLMPETLIELKDRTIRTVVIRHWSKEEVLYHIFLRLNTGSVQLSPQELRNALHPGPFAQFVDTYSADSPGLRRILKTNSPDFRMRDAELLLRFYAFRNFLPRYAGSMKKFLDTTTEEFNRDWAELETDIREQAKQVEAGIELAYEVFGDDDVFRKWKDSNFAGRFNRAVYDIVMFHFSNPDLQRRVRRSATAVKRAYIRLSRTHPEFVGALETTTKSLEATTLRLSLWTRTLARVLSVDLPTLRLVNNRIVI